MAYLGKLISSIDRAFSHRNGILNDLYICLVTLAAYGSIYLNVKEYETKTEMHVNSEYEQQNMVAASISTFFCFLGPSLAADEN